MLAQHKIVLQAGQTRLTLEGDDITFACPGQFTVKASRHPFLGGELNVAPLSALPGSLISDFGYDEQFRLVADDGETPLSRCRYRITGNNGDAWEGITDEDGLTERVFTLVPTKLDVEIIGNSDGAEVIT